MAAVEANNVFRYITYEGASLEALISMLPIALLSFYVNVGAARLPLAMVQAAGRDDGLAGVEPNRAGIASGLVWTHAGGRGGRAG